MSELLTALYAVIVGPFFGRGPPLWVSLLIVAGTVGLLVWLAKGLRKLKCSVLPIAVLCALLSPFVAYAVLWIYIGIAMGVSIFLSRGQF